MQICRKVLQLNQKLQHKCCNFLYKNKAASPQPLHKIIVYFELMQSGKKKHNGYWRTEIFDFVLRRMQQQPDEVLSQSRDNESLVATALVTPMCVSAISGKFRTGIQFFLLYRNEVSYKAKKTIAIMMQPSLDLIVLVFR